METINEQLIAYYSKSDQSLEAATKKTGRDLLSKLGDSKSSMFSKKFWEGRITDWLLKNEDFKIGMFRFIDVLPTLNSQDELSAHIKAYFGDTELNSTIKNLLGFAGGKGIAAKLAAGALKKNIAKMANGFIVGEDLDKSMNRLLKLRKKGIGFTMDLLGEASVSEKEADLYLARYVSLIKRLSELQNQFENNSVETGVPINQPKVNLSLKLTSLYSQIDPVDINGSINALKKRLFPLLELAMKNKIFITIDMESYYYKDLTLRLFREIMLDKQFESYPYFGIVIQSYLKDSLDDTESILKWAGQRKAVTNIRLVKGAYWDYENVISCQKGWPVPVFNNKSQTDAMYERISDLLLRNIDTVRPAFAGHNIRTISKSIALAESLNINKRAFEFQVLYGMGEPIAEILSSIGYMTRVYAPVGELLPGVAYLIRRLLENTSNQSWLLQSQTNLTSGELLANPFKNLSIEKEKEAAEKKLFENEPPLDFSKTDVRNKFSDALKEIEAKFPFDVYPIINDKKLRNGQQAQSVNPANPEHLIGNFYKADTADCETAIKTGWENFDKWSAMSVEKRADILFKAAAIMRKKRYELAAIQVYEAAKPWKEAEGDVTEAIDYLEYYGREAIRLLTPKKMMDIPGENNSYFYRPRGLGAVISPWNFPLAISVGMISAALVTGNCVIYKPSSETPVVGSYIVNIFKESGIPNGVLSFLPGDGSAIGNYLITHKRVHFVVFTGSKSVGLNIVEKAGITTPDQWEVKKTITEMGGKNAVIVDNDADLDEAVKGVVQSAFGYSGQKCSACSRVIVLEDAYDNFVNRLKEAVLSLKIGNPSDPATKISPVIDAKAKEKINSYIETGKKEATLYFQGKAPEKGYFVPPTIFTDVSADATIACEEIFGPVLAVIKAKSFDEAISIANGVVYGLTGGVYSRNPVNLNKARERFAVGNLYLNRSITGAIVGRQPFGGFKMSGVGSKAGGPDYLLQFVKPVVVTENSTRRGFTPEFDRKISGAYRNE